MPPNFAEAPSAPPSPRMRDRLVVALDVSTAAAARELIAKIGNAAGMYKVGLQLFTAAGPDFVRELTGSGRRVFLDLKLHDIPNTVRQAVKAASQTGASLITVHAAGGSEMLRAAVEGSAGRLGILAVTVLTSFDEDDLHETGVSQALPEQVRLLASLAREAGCAGVVTSPRETAMIRRTFGPEFLIVNPGIRPAEAGKDDQERIATPAAAIAAGASHIVVGRPVTQASDPAKAAEKIVLAMEQ